MSFRDFIIVYVEVGLILAIIEPTLWHILKPGDSRDWLGKFTGNFAYDSGLATGIIVGSVIGWPIHLFTWYILDPFFVKQKSEKES